MRKKCSQYTSEQISRFVDNELSRSEYRDLDAHRKACPDCQALIQDYQSLARVFAGHAETQVKAMNCEQLNKNMSQVFTRPAAPFGTFFTKNIYLKLASIVAIVVISLVAFQGRLIIPAGPSAIVDSVDSESGSVMIIETEKEKHTIIWFSEA